MKKKNQMADLRRLISLPHSQMKRLAPEYLYESPARVLKYLFKLIQSEKLNATKKRNLLTLTRFVLDRFETDEIPSWLAVAIDRFLRNDNFSLIEKAMVISRFSEEQLMEAVPGYGDFLKAIVETYANESLEEFIVDEINEDPGTLVEIFNGLFEKSDPEAIKFLLEELEEKSYPQVLKVLELLTYHSDEEVAKRALMEIAEVKNQDALRRLYSISRLNLSLRDEAEALSIELMYDLPMPEDIGIRRSKEEEKYQDIRVSLIDGKGSMSAFIAKKTSRGRYFLANLLMNTETGIKDTHLVTGLTYNDYIETKRFILREEEITFYPIPVEYLQKLLGHFLYINIKNGIQPPTDVIIIKNILDWDDLEPQPYHPEIPDFRPLRYHPRDMNQFPFNNWWLHEKIIYDMLRPYRHLTVLNLPSEIYDEVYSLMLEYASKKLVPMCSFCADIIRNSNYRNRTRQIRLFLTLRQEILRAAEEDMYFSEFLQMNTVRTINNVLYNLSMGVNSPEEAEEY